MGGLEMTGPGEKRDFVLSGESEKLKKDLLGTLNGEAGGAKIAVFQVYINRIFNINDAEETIELDFYVKVNWIDKKFVNVSDDDFQDMDNRFDEGWWEPGVEISNGVDLNKLIEYKEAFWVEVPEHGILAYTQRYIGKVSCPLYLKHFPFDCQTIPLVFESFHWKAGDLVLRRLPHHSHQVRQNDPNFIWHTVGKDVKLTEWTVHSIALEELMNYYAFEDRTYSQIIVKINLQRSYAYHLSKIIFFVCMIVIMSWSVFFMDAEDISGRISITVTLFLAEVAFNFVLSSSLPKIPYNTSLDSYLQVSYVYTFFSLVESIVVFLTHKYADDVIAKYLDWACLAFFAFSYLIYNSYYLIANIVRSAHKVKAFLDPKAKVNMKQE